jgi:hypothetical protein
VEVEKELIWAVLMHFQVNFRLFLGGKWGGFSLATRAAAAPGLLKVRASP